MIHIRIYSQKRDYASIIQSLKRENWQSFYEERKIEYMEALIKSKTLVIYEGEEYVGYIRGITDGYFTLFIPEIIIEPQYRRKGYGRMLIEYIKQCYPKTRIDLISENDAFYIQQGFQTVGNGMRQHDWY